jgi:hypothetical protein
LVRFCCRDKLESESVESQAADPRPAFAFGRARGGRWTVDGGLGEMGGSCMFVCLDLSSGSSLAQSVHVQLATAIAMSGFRGERTYNGQAPPKLKGLFERGVWKCDCDPRLPAVHFQVKKVGPTKGRWCKVLTGDFNRECLSNTASSLFLSEATRRQGPLQVLPLARGRTTTRARGPDDQLAH